MALLDQDQPQQSPAQIPGLPPDASPAMVYAAHKQLGLSDLDAALKARDSLRRDAESRSGFRDATEFFTNGMSGKPRASQDAFRAQLMGEADQPLKDASMRAQAGYTQALADPRHPVNQTFQNLVKQALPGVPADKLTVLDADQLGGPMKMLSDHAKAMAEAGKASAEGLKTTVTALPEARKTQAEADRAVALTPAEVALKSAEAGKTGAEGAHTAALTPVDVAKGKAEARNVGAEAATKEAGLPSAGPAAAAAVSVKEAEAREKRAQAGKLEQETSGDVTPEYSVRGDIGVTPEVRKEFAEKAVTTKKTTALIDELQKLLQGGDFVASPAKVAKANVLANQLLLVSKESAGIRGLPAQDVNFLQEMTGNFNLSGMRPLDAIKKLAGLQKNPERLAELKNVLQRGLDIEANARGLQRKGAAGAPQDADAVTWARSHPDDARSKKILKLNGLGL